MNALSLIKSGDDMNKPYTFAERLRTIMKERGLSNSAIAKLCDIDKSNITRYLSGTYEAKQDVVYRMASRLNINPAWLMGYDVPIEADSNVIPSEDDDLSSYLEELRTRPEMKMLFKTSKGMTKEQIQAVVQMIENLKNN